MKINRIEKNGEVSYSVEGFSSAEIGKRLKEILQRMSWKRYFKRNPERNRKYEEHNIKKKYMAKYVKRFDNINGYID